MTEFTIHTPQSAPQGSKQTLAELEGNIGFVPNLAATIAGSPAAMRSFVAMQSALRGSSLSALEREVVGLTVSHENSCAYSMAAHSTFAAVAGAGDELLAALRSGDALPDARLQALHAFAKALVRGNGHVGDEVLGAFLEAGYPVECALEAIAQVAYTTMANFVANVADPAVDAAFADRAWTNAAAVTS